MLLQFADVQKLEAAARTLNAGSRDDDALTLRIPSDGNVQSIKAVLDQLDHATIEVNELSLHTPDLDDVFFAITSHSETQKESVQ